MTPFVEERDRYPGADRHQALLHAIVRYYLTDPRILAISVFGSLGRGTWHRYSDIDLDIVVGDDVQIDVQRESKRLCDSFASINERAALIIPDSDDAVDIVLASLIGLSIRYHPLHTTSPNIVSSLHTLMLRINEGEIVVAGSIRQQKVHVPLSQLLDRCVRHAVEVRLNLHRGQLWGAIESLHRMRLLLMELYARTRDGERPLPAFQSAANSDLQALLGATLPSYEPTSIENALVRFIDVLEQNLAQFTDGHVALTGSQNDVITRIRSNVEQA